MRIGMMLRALDERYGIGIYTRSILRELLELDTHNQYLLMYRSAAHLGTYSQHPNVQEVVVNAPNKLTWDQLAVPWHSHQWNVDLTFNTKFTVPLVSSCKTIMVLHGSEWFVYPEFYPWWDIQYVRAVMPLYLKRADAVISVSDKAKEDIVLYTGVEPGKIKTVYLAASEQFRVVEDKVALKVVRQKYGLPERFLLFVGKIYPGKNVGNLLRAFARIRERFPHKLVWCGEVLWKHEADLQLLEQLDLQNDVLRIGWVEQEDLPALYSLAEAFVFPSIYESFGIPTLEAMACGCPVVTSNTGGTPEVVGDAAVLVDPRDVDSITSGIYGVLTDQELRRSLVEKGFGRVKRFSWEKCARETLKIIEQVEKH